MRWWRKRAVDRGDSHLSEEELNDFVDRALDEVQREHVTTHLAECDECRSQVARIAELIAVSRADAEMVVAPTSLSALIMATTIYERLARTWALRLLRWPFALGVILVTLSASGFTAWVLLACPPLRADKVPAIQSAAVAYQCNQPWYFVVRDAAKQRYKELRNRERDNVRRARGL